MNQNCVSSIAAKGNEISRLALQLWKKAGRPEGRDWEFWLRAERHIIALHKPEAVKVESVVAKPSIEKRVLMSPFQTRPTNGGGPSTV